MATPQQQALQILQTPVIMVTDGALVFANDAMRQWLTPMPIETALNLSDASSPILQNINKACTEQRALRIHELSIAEHLCSMQISVLAENSVLIECIPLHWYRETQALDELDQRYTLQQQVSKGLAHELRNPLGGIQGAAQLLMRDKNPKQAVALQMIVQQCQRMDRLLKDLLSQDYTLGKSACDIHKILHEVIAVIQHEFTVDIVEDYDPSLPELYLDTDGLHQALLNIVKNAAQAQAQTIQVSTRIERGRRLSNHVKRTVIAIHVDDDGLGVPSNIADSLFFPLVSARSGGSGLGLAQVQSLIHAHGGLVTYTARTQGSRFSIFLPLQSHE